MSDANFLELEGTEARHRCWREFAVFLVSWKEVHDGSAEPVFEVAKFLQSRRSSISHVPCYCGCNGLVLAALPGKDDGRSRISFSK
jgi:hypothetical protein